MNVQLPPYIANSDEGSFARLTVETRFPRIVNDVAAAFPEADPHRTKLAQLKDEIARGKVIDPFMFGLDERLFNPREAAAWHEEIGPRLGLSWKELPFYFSEAYLYLRILLASGYYDKTAPYFLWDPFEPQKEAELAKVLSSRDWEDSIAVFQEALAAGPSPEVLEELLLFMLKGNRIDLSNAGIAEHGRTLLHKKGRDDLLLDQTAEIAERIGKAGRLDIILDNAGSELVCDLVFAAYYLTVFKGTKLCLHAKNAPLFVSDSMVKDVLATVRALRSHAGVAEIGRRLDEYLSSGRLVVKPHFFWNGPKHFTALPEDIASDLAGSDLVFVKGDANFRRLIEDRRWPRNVRLEEKAGSFPAVFAVLRTLKSEIAANIDVETEKRVSALDPSWLFDGKWGVVQLVVPSG